jgi:signal transduction histidine kinase
LQVHAFAQETVIENLVVRLDSLSGKERIETLLQLATHQVVIDPVKTISYCNEIIDLAGDDLEWKWYKAEAHNIVGLVDLESARFDASLQNFEKAMVHYQQLNDSAGITSVFINLGYLYDQQGYYDEALKNYEQAKSICEATNDIYGLGTVVNNIAEIEYAAGEYNQALTNYRKALNYLRQTGIEDQMSTPLHNMGRTFLKTGDLDSAAFYLQNAYQYNTRYLDREGVAYDQLSMGRLYEALNDSATSRMYYDSALQIAEEMNLQNFKLMVLEALYESYEVNGQFEKALEYHIKYHRIKDSLYNILRNRQFLIYQSRFELDQKEKEISLLKADSQIKVLELKRRRSFVIFMFGMVLLLIILLIVLNNQYRLKKESNKMLEARHEKITEQNRKLNEFNKQLQDSREELKRLNNTKDKFFSIISHDLKSPLNSVSGMLNLMRNHSESVDEKDRRMLMDRLYKSVNDLSELTNNLLQWALTQMGKTDFNPQILNLYETIEDHLDMFHESADQKEITFENDISQDHLIYADKNMLSFIVRNILNNSIKFTNTGGKITCTSEELDKAITFTITDTGVGMNEATIQKVLNKEEYYTSIGTNNEKGTGLGLALCKEFMDLHSGELTVKSKMGEGTAFTFRFPLLMANQKRSNKQGLQQSSP